MPRTPDDERILGLLAGTDGLSSARIKRALGLTDERYNAVRGQLLKERLVEKYACQGGGLRLTRRGKRIFKEAPPPPIEQVDDLPITTGTGFFVSASGHVLTNAHVIENLVEGRRIRVSIGGQSSLACVVARDGPNDLALLRIEYRPRVLPVFRSNVRVAENIAVIGFPLIDRLDSAGNFTNGVVSALSARNNTGMFQITAPVNPGNSGGPIFDQSGNVVGLVVSGLDAVELMMTTGSIPESVNFGIKADVALAFLRTHGVRPSSKAVAKEQPWPLVYERGRSLTVLIECNVPDDGSSLPVSQPQQGFWNKFKSMMSLD